LSPRPQRRIGRFHLVRRIGRGGSGEVWLARLEAVADVRRLAAVKVLFHASDDPQHHAALLAEARLGALLSHPNVVQVLDAGVENGLSWFAMEFVPGLSVFELSEAAERKVPPWIAARIVADACAAVHALHEATDEEAKPLNVVHRDVTPHNLLVSWDGVVKLVDLGVAHSALRASVTRTGTIKGNLGYMSPEQASGAAVDRRCDVFALGVQLWEALAGRRLFRGQSDSETLASIVRGDIPSLRATADVPAPLIEVAVRALMIDRTARFATALEMQRALDGALGRAGIVIGSKEVAELMAHVAPSRVREHIRWLHESEVETDGVVPEVSLPADRAVGQPDLRRRRRRSLWLTSAIAIVTLVVAMGVVIRRPAADRPPPEARSQSSVPEAPAATSMPIVAHTVDPPATAPPSASVTHQHSAEARKHGLHRPSRQPATAPLGVGTLYVNASPAWASIDLDGKPIGTTPLVVKDLAAGAHTVVAQALGKGSPARQQVTIEAGGTARIGFELQEP
jgi:serine/threonine-protein kinase